MSAAQSLRTHLNAINPSEADLPDDTLSGQRLFAPANNTLEHALPAVLDSHTGVEGWGLQSVALPDDPPPSSLLSAGCVAKSSGTCQARQRFEVF